MKRMGRDGWEQKRKGKSGKMRIELKTSKQKTWKKRDKLEALDYKTI